VASVKNITKFFSEVRIELARVEWPKFDDFVGSTLIVLLMIVLFTTFFGVVDKMLSVVAQYFFTFGR
jgi:preprotein translocase, SecE subunit, bacterial